MKLTHTLLAVATAGLVVSNAHGADGKTEAGQPAKEVYVYNWTDYIAPDTNAKFTEKTGIRVVYDVYDSNEVLESKLLSGRSGYDIVSPSHDFYATQIKAGVYAPLDKSLIPNLKNLDPGMMKLISDTVDPGNKYGIPYTWGTTGIGYNVKKVRAALGDNAPVDSWSLVYDPAVMKKLSEHGCAVGFIDAPTEVLPSVIKYLHADQPDYDPNNATSADYRAATEQLKKVRPYITYFNSGKIISDLANGDICVAVTWSGEVMQAEERAKEAKNGVKLAYSIPKEGAGVWFDMLAVPNDAPHKKAAMEYINFILDPKINADIVNYIGYASADEAAKPYVDKDLLNNQGVYPDAETQARLFLFKPLQKKMTRTVTRNWTSIKTAQ